MAEHKEIPWPARQHEVRAILAGRQTRFSRPIKLPKHYEEFVVVLTTPPVICIGPAGFIDDPFPMDNADKIIHSPYGKPGDVLWVRETWSEDDCEVMHYRADCEGTHTEHGYKILWKPSIHMPKSACRLRLLVKSVRVERV